MAELAVIGSITRDVVDGGLPRPGGVPLYAGRALRVLGSRARIVARCAAEDRRALLTPVVALGLPVTWRPGEQTTGFSFRYEADRRVMRVDAVGDPWTVDDVRGWAGRGLGRAEWVLVGGVLRSDFAPATLASLARGRRLLVDGQGLARVAETGPLQVDGEVDRGVLRHVTVLKLSEREAETLAGGTDESSLRSLGVPEVVVTLGSHGALVLAGRRLERVQARPVTGAVDPTGAGDAFAAVYLASRAAGHSPASAGKRAAALVAGLLAGRSR